MSYERLTDKNDLYWALQETKLSAEVGIYLTDCLNRLAEFEDKIEQGTLIELPCKVGDTVWEVSPFSNFPTAITAPNIYTILRWKEDGAFGSELFLTYAEAENKLKELQE